MKGRVVWMNSLLLLLASSTTSAMPGMWTGTLDNGMKLIFLEDHSWELAALRKIAVGPDS